MQSSQAHNLGKALSQEAASCCGTGHEAWDPSAHVCATQTPSSVQDLKTLTLACCWRKIKRSPKRYLPLAGMRIGTEWGKNKSFEHNMQECVQICFMAELELFLIVNMSHSFVPPPQKCVLLGVRFYSWPLSHTGQANSISLSLVLPILETLLLHSILLRFWLDVFHINKRGSTNQALEIILAIVTWAGMLTYLRYFWKSRK